MTVENEPVPTEFYDELDKCVDHRNKSRQHFDNAVVIIRNLGYGDFEISCLLREYLRNKLPDRTLRRYLDEFKPKTDESSISNQPKAENDDNNDTEQESETPTEITVTTEGLQLPHPEPPPEGQDDFKEYQKQEEDPKDLEISFLKEKVSELEEALKKTQQFTPATQLEPKPFLDDDIVIEYLKERAKETGEIIDFGRVGSGALVQRLAPYKNSFGVIELFGRIVTK